MPVLELSLLGALVVAILFGIWRWSNNIERRVKTEVENEAIRDTQDRLEKGRAALNAARGNDPVEQLRSNTRKVSGK